MFLIQCLNRYPKRYERLASSIVNQLPGLVQGDDRRDAVVSSIADKVWYGNTGD